MMTSIIHSNQAYSATFCSTTFNSMLLNVNFIFNCHW